MPDGYYRPHFTPRDGFDITVQRLDVPVLGSKPDSTGWTNFFQVAPDLVQINQNAGEKAKPLTTIEGKGDVVFTVSKSDAVFKIIGNATFESKVLKDFTGDFTKDANSIYGLKYDSVEAQPANAANKLVKYTSIADKSKASIFANTIVTGYISGVNTVGAFFETGAYGDDTESAKPSTAFYWAQYVKTDIDETPVGSSAVGAIFDHLKATPPKFGEWKVDQPEGFTKAGQPRYYPGQDDNKAHLFTDDPGLRLWSGIDQKRVDEQNKALLLKPGGTRDEAIKGVYKAVEKFGTTATLAISFQSYVVETANKTPLGWVSWGYTVTVDAPKQSVTVTVTAPEWHAGVDAAVWTKL